MASTSPSHENGNTSSSYQETPSPKTHSSAYRTSATPHSRSETVDTAHRGNRWPSRSSAPAAPARPSSSCFSICMDHAAPPVSTRLSPGRFPCASPCRHSFSLLPAYPPTTRIPSARAAHISHESLSISRLLLCSNRDPEGPGHPGPDRRSPAQSYPDPALSRHGKEVSPQRAVSSSPPSARCRASISDQQLHPAAAESPPVHAGSQRFR